MTDFAAVCSLNTRLFLNCLESVTDEQAMHRVSDRVNNIAFIAIHVVDARHYLAAQLGLETSNPFSEAFKDVSSIEEVTTMPPLDEIRRTWTDVSSPLERRLTSLLASESGRPSDLELPIDGGTLGSAISFLLAHEMYHIGQMAMLRKHAGLPAMSWS